MSSDATLQHEELTSSSTGPVLPQRESFGPSDAEKLLAAAKAAERNETAESVEAWEAVLNAMSEFDEKLISDWTDDLQNLLTFAGLFSAVVTAFVVLSYALLERGSDDATAMIVTGISQQVASFKISSGYINSTIPAASLGPFVTTKLDVQLNTLWFLSLAMSLVASLFDIMVQQWLREYRTPTHSSVREAVRLRELRRRAFHDWAVPVIISTIPILLQIALLLFLTGVCYLLLSLNKSVFKPFVIFLALALLLFAATILMPLFFRTCAYKSPTSFALLWFIQSCLIVLSIVATALVLVPPWVITWAVSHAVSSYMPSLQARTQVWATRTRKRVERTWSRILQPIRKIPIHRRSSGNEFWVARERAALPDAKHLDERALTWVLPWLPQEQLPLLKRCLGELSREERIRVVVKWIGQTLNASASGLRIAEGSILDSSILSRIDSHFAERYSDVLMDALPEIWMSPKSPIECKYGSTVLTMLQEIATNHRRDNKPFLSWYTQRLMKLRHSQQPLRVTSESSTVRLPAVYLMQCTVVLDNIFGERDVAKLFSWAEERMQSSIDSSEDGLYWINSFEILFASTATVLSVVAKQQDRMKDPNTAQRILDLLTKLTKVVHQEQERIRTLIAKADEWCTDGVPFFTLPAFTSLCESIVLLAGSGYLWTKASCPSRDFVRALVDLFSNEVSFAHASTVLEALDCVTEESPSPGASDDYVEPIVQRSMYKPLYTHAHDA
ncbi:hypothetical protein NM688_g7877 [Phlebia brevispora]|uniref:Uncharacterized protein n=1 Tax=Phlebia brevispora TaxID=194682 RepID=A0ACC1S047_9APHY|nr:hypothetical protein NM688_g7877 [Phlebia brevispora]